MQILMCTLHTQRTDLTHIPKPFTLQYLTGTNILGECRTLWGERQQAMQLAS